MKQAPKQTDEDAEHRAHSEIHLFLQTRLVYFLITTLSSISTHFATFSLSCCRPRATHHSVHWCCWNTDSIFSLIYSRSLVALVFHEEPICAIAAYSLSSRFNWEKEAAWGHSVVYSVAMRLRDCCISRKPGMSIEEIPQNRNESNQSKRS